MPGTPAPPDPQVGSQAPHQKPNVAVAGGIMMAALFLSRILGILRDTVMAAKFGIQLDTDAYRLAFTIPDLLFFLVAGGALSSAFIPIFSELLHTDREDDAWELFSVVTTVMSIIVIAFIAVAWVFAPQIAAFMAAGKDPATIRLVVVMSRIVLPAQFAFFIGGLMFGTLYARQRFVAPGLAPNIYNLGIIAGALFLASSFHPGIIGMSWGALIGAFLGSLVLPLLVMRKLGARYRFSLNVQAPGVKRVFILMLPVILGLGLPSVYAIIMQKYGSRYPAGINTALDLSNKLMQAPLGIFGQSLALAAFPALAQFFAQKRMDLYRQQLSSSIRTVIYLTVPASVILFVLAPQTVQVAYGYGKADPATLPPIAACLRMFAFGIPAWCIQPVLMRAFFAIHKSAKPIVISTLTTVVFVGLYWILKGAYGYLALPLSGSIASVGLVVVMFGAASSEVGGLEVGPVLRTFGKSLAASLVMGAFLYGAFLLVPPGERKILLILVYLLAVTIGGWIYFFVTKALGMKETEYISRALAKFNRKASPITPQEAGSD